MFSLCSGGRTNSSPYLEFVSRTSFGFTILSAILFPINSPVASAAYWDTFLFAIFKAFSLVFVAASNNCLSNLLDRFLPTDKNSYPLTYFTVISSIK